MQPVFLPLLLLALALPLRADSDILPAKLDGSGTGLNGYAEDYGRQGLAFNVERRFTLDGAFAQPSGALINSAFREHGTTALRGSGACNQIYAADVQGLAPLSYRRNE